MAKSLIKQLTDDTEPEDVLRTGISLVLFGAPWCAPAEQMRPTLEALAKKHTGEITVYDYNVTEYNLRQSRANIKGIPTLVIYNRGSYCKALTGYQSLDKIEQLIEETVNHTVGFKS